MQTASEADVARGCARPPDICCRRHKQSNGFPISGGGENHLAGELPTHRWGVEPTRSSDYEPRLRPGLGNPDSSGTPQHAQKHRSSLRDCVLGIGDGTPFRRLGEDPAAIWAL